MESEKLIETNGKYYISQILILPGKPYEVGKYTTTCMFTGQRVKKYCYPIKLYYKLGNAKKRYDKLVSKKQTAG